MRMVKTVRRGIVHTQRIKQILNCKHLCPKELQQDVYANGLNEAHYKTSW